MAEYEPDDSRDVTQSAHHAPGEPPRTGPREDAARAQAEQREVAHKDEMAIDNPAGDPRPEYDQYKLNDPQAIDKRDARNIEAEDEGEDDV